MDTLENICLDKLILSVDPEVIKMTWQLPDHIVQLMDRRYQDMQYSEKYRKRFKHFPTFSNLEFEDLSDPEDY